MSDAKKGQSTLFIILGLVIVFAVIASVSYLKYSPDKKLREREISFEADILQEKKNLDECVQESFNEAIFRGSRSNMMPLHVELEDGTEIGYTYFKGKMFEQSKEKLEKYMFEVLSEGVKNCADELSERQTEKGRRVEISEPRILFNVSNESIECYAKVALSVADRNNTKKILSDHDWHYDSSIELMVQAINELTKDTKKSGGMIDASSLLAMNFDFEIHPLSDGSTLYHIIDSKGRFSMYFAHKY